mmetsp:Transcript_84364/g.149160  ORF Transcript_84364/g.149160 Transcript_84364/m.149160 type:complete len:317 (+) Transcript_84364:35-985(+)
MACEAMDSTRHRSQRGPAQKLLRLSLIAVSLVWTTQRLSVATFCSGLIASYRSPSHMWRRSAAEPKALRGTPSLQLIQAQVGAGHKMKDLGNRLQHAEFKGSALDGKAVATFDGVQTLKSLEIAEDALQEAGGSKELAEALLSALQQGHDSSVTGTEGDVWNMYQSSPELMEAPLTQIGAGKTAQDLWENVTKTDESTKLAEELFTLFDEDKDGWWNLEETSKVQMATEGTEMAEESFNSLIIAAAPDGGRRLTEEQMANGLSKEQVIDLYTNAAKQRQLGFVLDIYKDHAKVFKAQAQASEDEPKAEPKATLTVD